MLRKEGCCDKAYYCPTAGEDECGEHGGFDICCGHPELHIPYVNAPDTGHLWRLIAFSKMSSKVVGEEHNTDSGSFGPPLVAEVRAFDLPTALRKAATLPLREWIHPDE